MKDIVKIKKEDFYQGLIDYKYNGSVSQDYIENAKGVNSVEHQILINTRAVLKTLLIEHKKDCKACERITMALTGAIEHINDVDIE